MLSQNLVQGCVKTWSKYVAQQNWTKFWRKKNVFFSFFLLAFLKNLILPAERRIFLKNKKKEKTEKTWTKFWLKKRLFLDQVLTLQHIYIYASGHLLVVSGFVPRFVVIISCFHHHWLRFFVFFWRKWLCPLAFHRPRLFFSRVTLPNDGPFSSYIRQCLPSLPKLLPIFLFLELISLGSPDKLALHGYRKPTILREL